MYYPCLWWRLAAWCSFALLTYVVPTVTTVFANMRQTLPWPTVVLIAVSGFLRSFWWLLGIGIVCMVLLVQRYSRTARGTQRFDSWKIRAPVFGKLTLKLAMSRFTRTLGILLRSGIPVLDALDISSAVVNNTVLAHAITEAKEAIREGADIAGPLKASGYFPPLVSHMISIGEKVASLKKCSCASPMPMIMKSTRPWKA